jgi:hypothetical protein
MLKTEVLVLVILAFIALFYSTVFDEAYHYKLVELYKSPVARLFLIVCTIGLYMWSMPVGIMATVVTLFYIADIGLLSEKRIVRS